jgi:hypothetical protein
MPAALIQAAVPLLPANPSFAGHQTFALRSGWLKKGVDALEQVGSGIFNEDHALVVLGVGKNMVQSIRHWLLVTGMARDLPGIRGRALEVTGLGRELFGALGAEGWDPYLEDPASLWLLHWQLASAGSLAFSWVWTFNFFRDFAFSKETLTDSVRSGAAAHVVKPPSPETLGRDIECLIHCYVEPQSSSAAEDELDCPLRGLGLIQPSFGRHYRFQHGPKPSLPPAVFCYALSAFWERRYASRAALSLRDLTYAEGSPGLVFKLDEDAVLGYLDTLEATSAGAYRFEDTPLSRQVLRTAGRSPEPLEFLRAYYDSPLEQSW